MMGSHKDGLKSITQLSSGRGMMESYKDDLWFIAQQTGGQGIIASHKDGLWSIAQPTGARNDGKFMRLVCGLTRKDIKLVEHRIFPDVYNKL